MLASLKIILDTEELDYRAASEMQGVLFDRIESDYADKLHAQGMHPYSQYIIRKGNVAEWKVQTLNKEAYENIILPFMDGDVDNIYIKNKNKSIAIKSKAIETKSKKELMNEFYEKESSGILSTEFTSATAFKRAGNYCILPEIRLIFQNLMQKYTASSDNVDMIDEDTLEELAAHTFVSRHNIRSVAFPLEGTKIPGFMGSVNIRVKGSDTLKRYVRLLLEFGEYSGIGIKTAMGMGAFKIKSED